MTLTHDAFLGGRVMIWQPAQGYRAGVDPVFLAASCPALPGESVLDLGCGVGAAALCLGARVPGLALSGVERQPDIADLARRNVMEAGAQMSVITADLADLPMDLRQQSFHHVIANPPYFDRSASLRSTHAAREAALGEATPLDVWVKVAARRLRPKGWLTLVHRPERLPDIMAALQGRLGSIVVLPLQPRSSRSASLILLRARKDGRADFRLLPPMILHIGEMHISDEAHYTQETADILRNGAPVSAFGD